jgi:arsenate reductase
MAEGWTRKEFDNHLEVFSAGVVKHGLDPKAVRVMDEAGVDISGQSSKTVDELPVMHFDVVITLCDHANESCPFFPGPVQRHHKSFDDPPSLTANPGDKESGLDVYRRVRDEIHAFVLTLPEILAQDDQQQRGDPS